MSTIESIIPYLYDIAITMGIISICYALWIQAKHYGENLTMEENPIRIILENYCGQRITFTMSENAKVESLFELDTNSIKITHISINAYDNDILIKKEDLT